MKHLINYLLLILSAFLFSASLISNQAIVKEIPPSFATFYRFFIAGIIMFVYNICRRVNLKLEKKDLLYLIMMSFIGYTLNSLFFNKGIKITSAINASIIVSTIPIATLLLSIVFLKKRVSIWNVIAMCVSLFGVLSMILNWDFSKLANIGNQGDLLFLLGVLASSIYIIGIQSILQKNDALVIVMYMFIFSFLTVIPFMIPEFKSSNIMNTSKDTWIAILVTGVFGGAAAYSLQQLSIKYLGSIITSLSVNLVPIFVALTSYILFGTVISPKSIFSMFIVIIGVVTSTLIRTSYKK